MGLIKTAGLFSRSYKNLFIEMVRTDFKLRYQGSVLGYLWSLLKPLLLFAILYTVFTKFLQIGKGIPNWPLSLLMGIVLWSFFSEATAGAMKSVVAKGSLIRKINIPRYLIPIASISSAFINLLLNLLVVFIFVIFASNTALSWQTLWAFPLLLLELTIITAAISFFLAAAYVRFRDIEYIWDVVRQGLFYSIPIIYPLERLSSEMVRKLLMLNPLAQIIQDTRNTVTYRGATTLTHLYENPLIILVPIGLTFFTLCIGVAYFRKHSPYFAEDI